MDGVLSFEVIMSTCTMTCLGDSITQGWHVPTGDSWPALLESRYGLKTLNFGVSGDTTGDALNRLDNVLTARKDLIFIELGLNDFFMGLPVESAAENLSRIIQAFLCQDATVVLAGFLFRGQGSGSWEAMYHDLADKFSILLYANIFQGLEECNDCFFHDGIHPNSKGYSIMADEICRFIYPLLSHKGDSKS